MSLAEVAAGMGPELAAARAEGDEQRRLPRGHAPRRPAVRPPLRRAATPPSRGVRAPLRPRWTGPARGDRALRGRLPARTTRAGRNLARSGTLNRRPQLYEAYELDSATRSGTDGANAEALLRCLAAAT